MGLILFDQTALQRSGVLRKEIPRSTPLHSTPTILILVSRVVSSATHVMYVRSFWSELFIVDHINRISVYFRVSGFQNVQKNTTVHWKYST